MLPLRSLVRAAALPILLAGCGNPWARVREPAAGPPESFGSYSAGCIRGAAALESNGDGWQTVRLSRRRYFGHPAMIAFIQRLAGETKAQGLGSLLIADIGMPRGGPTLSAHASHQIGLDVDIWYRQVTDGHVLSPEERENWDTPSMVTPDFQGLNSAWNPKEIEILKLAASDPQVERIFVNPVIKKTICAMHGGEPWVAKIRPWWDHDDHFHVRLRCQPGDGLCVNRADPLPPGDSCDATLDAWFSPENKAKEKRLREHPEPSTMPTLPLECASVLKE